MDGSRPSQEGTPRADRYGRSVDEADGAVAAQKVALRDQLLTVRRHRAVRLVHTATVPVDL